MNLGLLVYSMGDKEKALASLKKAAALNPKFQEELKSTLRWTGHAGLDEELMKKLFPDP